MSERGRIAGENSEINLLIGFFFLMAIRHREGEYWVTVFYFVLVLKLNRGRRRTC